MAATLALAPTVAPAAAHARPLDLMGRDWEGLADFVQLARDELAEGRVLATATLDLTGLKREDGVILIHPERALEVESLSAFMHAGGRVVLLDDFGTGDGLLRHFGLERVPMPDSPAEYLRGNPAFALAEPAGTHPVVRDVNRVVTNHPTGLRHPDLSPVLRVRAADGPDVLLAEAGAVGEGRLLAVGDGSVVMNSMLRFPGNRALARGIVRYAVDDDPSGARGGRLFVVSGALEQTGTFGGEAGVARQLRNAAGDAREALASAEKEGLPPMATYTLAIVVGLGIVLWVGARASKTHKAVLPRYVRPTPVLAHGGLAGHAAVIGAPRTSRALAMLELKSALEEQLAGLLGHDQVPAHDALLREIAGARLLDADGQRELARLLLRMATIETMVVARRAEAMERVRDREVVESAAVVRRLLERAESAAAGAGARP